MGMDNIKATWKVIWLAARPLSKTEATIGWLDVANIFIHVIWSGGGSYLTMLWDWFQPSYLAIVPAVLLLIAALKLQRRVDISEEKPRPHLEISGLPYTDKRAIRSVDASRKLIGEPFFCHVKFQNNPKIRSPQANACKVFSTITFYDMNGKQKLQLDKVRFSEIAEPPFRQPSMSNRDYYEVEFNANGHPWELTIALKYEEDDNCYAFDDESYNAPEWKKPQYLLQEKSYWVKVSLSGENTQGEWWFKLQNYGIGKDPQLELSPQPALNKVG